MMFEQDHVDQATEVGGKRAGRSRRLSAVRATFGLAAVALTGVAIFTGSATPATSPVERAHSSTTRPQSSGSPAPQSSAGASPTPPASPTSAAPTTRAPTTSQADGTSQASGTSQAGASAAPATATRQYPLHTGIISTTFWVGEIFDPTAADGSQMMSTYDSEWYRHYGGCDGVATSGACSTEARSASNGYFPASMTPRENPFYLDLPFDDVNDPTALATRQSVVPWASDPAYRGYATNPELSLMKNRWVRIIAHGRTCYGQIEDAGPGQYHDSAYVFGANNARPANQKFNNAGLDVSPALNGCLRYAELNGEDDLVTWQFVEASAVPAGPWLTLVTTRGVS